MTQENLAHRSCRRIAAPVALVLVLAFTLLMAAPALAYSTFSYKRSDGNQGTWYYTNARTTREGGYTEVRPRAGSTGLCGLCYAYVKTEPSGASNIESWSTGSVTMTHQPKANSRTSCKWTAGGISGPAWLGCNYFQS